MFIGAKKSSQKSLHLISTDCFVLNMLLNLFETARRVQKTKHESQAVHLGLGPQNLWTRSVQS